MLKINLWDGEGNRSDEGKGEGGKGDEGDEDGEGGRVIKKL